MRFSSTLLLLSVSSQAVEGFTIPACHSGNHLVRARAFTFQHAVKSFDETGNMEDDKATDENLVPLMKNSGSKVAAASALIWSSLSITAMAAGPDWGVFEGRTGSLLHPVMMGGMFVLSAYTAFLGFQWRRQRTIGDEISALKKQMPDLNGAKTISGAIEAVMAENPQDVNHLGQLRAAQSIEEEITKLQQERKDLVAAGPRDRHYNQGALLAFLGTAFAIEGPLNTYARAGKLFPGPHLYVGAALVVLWALAFACVPYMQKGNQTARNIHIGANVVNLGFFAWQVQSGIPILLKVIEKTKWP